MPTSDATLRAGEMKKALLEQIDHYQEDLKLEEVGEVLEVKDGVARIWGLSSAVANEMLEIESSETGELITALALNLEEDNIGAVVMGDYLQLKEGRLRPAHGSRARSAGGSGIPGPRGGARSESPGMERARSSPSER